MGPSWVGSSDDVVSKEARKTAAGQCPAGVQMRSALIVMKPLPGSSAPKGGWHASHHLKRSRATHNRSERSTVEVPRRCCYVRKPHSRETERYILCIVRLTNERQRAAEAEQRHREKVSALSEENTEQLQRHEQQQLLLQQQLSAVTAELHELKIRAEKEPERLKRLLDEKTQQTE